MNYHKLAADINKLRERMPNAQANVLRDSRMLTQNIVDAAERRWVARYDRRITTPSCDLSSERRPAGARRTTASTAATTHRRAA